MHTKKHVPIIEDNNRKTRILQEHIPMSYCFNVKASEDVPLELLTKYNIPSTLVLYSGKEEDIEEQNKNTDKVGVAAHFMKTIVNVGRNIEKLLKTNIPIRMTDDDYVKRINI